MPSNSIQGPAFWHVRLCSGNNHSPHEPLLSKATLAFFSPSTLLSLGQCGAGLPLAPWALLLAGGLLRWKPTPMVFFFVEKQELAGKCRLDAGPSNSPGAS